MFVDAESRRRVTIIPIEYGATFRGHFRLLVSGVEAGFLSEGSAGQTFSGTLCFAAQQRGSELHVPATAVGGDAGGVAGSGIVPAGSGIQVRSQPAGILSGFAAEGYEVRV